MADQVPIFRLLLLNHITFLFFPEYLVSGCPIPVPVSLYALLLGGSEKKRLPRTLERSQLKSADPLLVSLCPPASFCAPVAESCPPLILSQEGWK